MKKASKHERIRGWFQLLRLPHLFTVPGDPLIGFLIAGGLMRTQMSFRGFAGIAAVCFISFAMSLFGIISNDLADIQLDMTDHPDRPLPRGLISPRAASYAAQLCFLAAVVPSFFLGWRFSFVTLVALICIYTYNFYVKYRPKRASTMMAVMRDLMFGMGILIVHDISIRRILMLTLYGVGLFLYYCGLNEITRSETQSKMVRPGGGKMLAGACFCATVVALIVFKPFVLKVLDGQKNAGEPVAVASVSNAPVADAQTAEPATAPANGIEPAADAQTAEPATAPANEIAPTADAQTAEATTAPANEIAPTADGPIDPAHRISPRRQQIFNALAILLCALYLLIALWVYQVSRTGASPARVQMAVQVSFRAALMLQAAATASCGLAVLTFTLLFCLACSALAEKYSGS